METSSLLETLSKLQTDPQTGLSQREAMERLRTSGYNEVSQAKASPIKDFLGKFWGLSAWMLELIMVLSALLKKYSDLIIVGILLVINALIGFYQDRRSANAMAMLQKRLQVNARVLREGKWNILPARELVPGDMIRLRQGDIVPADIILLTGALSLDQSALTGESKEIDKNSGDTLPSGSIVRQGEGNGAVMLTGKNTHYGKTTELVQMARPKLHIEEVVAKVVRWLFMIVGVLVGIVAAMSSLRAMPITETLPLFLVLLMAAVPVALPVMFTVSMAIGAKELAKQGVLVTRLSAIEDAASMDVLCVDKTGTITMNQLHVADVIPLGNTTVEDVLLAGALASQEANQDPIDLAFLEYAGIKNLSGQLATYKGISFVPFNTLNRRTEAVVDLRGSRLRVMKGAVRTVAEICRVQSAAIETMEEKIGASAQKGYRTLAIARGAETETPVLIGLVTLADPVRPGTPELIRKLKEMGVPVKMLTGDALKIAGEIAREAGLGNIRRMSDLAQPDGHPETEAADILAVSDGLAEMYPEGKFMIVRQLQKMGHVAGMTGDGVNDAPALRQAEVGIAVNSATDVAKSAASVVLTQPGLTNIITLIEQGRVIYQRILTWIMNKISRTILKSTFVAIAFITTGKFVVSAFGMLLLVFMTDFAKITLATDHVRSSQKPETWEIGHYVFVSAVLGAAMVLEALALLFWGWNRFGLSTDDPTLYTFSFLTLLYFAVFSIVSVRERRRFWASRPNSALITALLADVIIGTVFAFAGLPSLAPLPWNQIGCILFYAAVSCLVVNDFLKTRMLNRFA